MSNVRRDPHALIAGSYMLTVIVCLGLGLTLSYIFPGNHITSICIITLMVLTVPWSFIILIYSHSIGPLAYPLLCLVAAGVNSIVFYSLCAILRRIPVID